MSMSHEFPSSWPRPRLDGAERFRHRSAQRRVVRFLSVVAPLRFGVPGGGSSSGHRRPGLDLPPHPYLAALRRVNRRVLIETCPPAPSPYKPALDVGHVPSL